MRVSPAQKAFKNTAEGFGFPFIEARGVDEVERFVRGLIAATLQKKTPSERGQGVKPRRKGC